MRTTRGSTGGVSFEASTTNPRLSSAEPAAAALKSQTMSIEDLCIYLYKLLRMRPSLEVIVLVRNQSKIPGTVTPALPSDGLRGSSRHSRLMQDLCPVTRSSGCITLPNPLKKLAHGRLCRDRPGRKDSTLTTAKVSDTQTQRTRSPHCFVPLP